MRDVTDSGKTKKEVEREWEKRKGNLSFLSLHKTLSFLAWAVNIFRFRLRTVADCESVTVTVTFAVTLCGISNDFFLKSRRSGRRGKGAGGRRVCLEACQSKLIECLCFIKFDFSASLARPPCQLRQTTAEADRQTGTQGVGGRGDRPMS